MGLDYDSWLEEPYQRDEPEEEDEDREPDDPPEMTDEDYGRLDDQIEDRAEKFFHGD